MITNVLFIHSAGRQNRGEGSEGLVRHLREMLGEDYEVRYPEMPDPENPRYLPWKNTLQQELNKITGNLILIGHSFGGSVLLKYLSEAKYDMKISALFIVAAPFWGEKDWEIDEYKLPANWAARLSAVSIIFFYHSKKDQWVPFRHMQSYHRLLPRAFIRPLESNEHEFSNGLPVLADDIRLVSGIIKTYPPNL